MFTLKFMNYTDVDLSDCEGVASLSSVEISERKLSHVFMRSVKGFEVWYPESSVYQNEVTRLVDEAKKTAEDKEEEDSLIFLHTTCYTAMITYLNDDDEESSYMIAETEECYVTDPNGNTVLTIK